MTTTAAVERRRKQAATLRSVDRTQAAVWSRYSVQSAALKAAAEATQGKRSLFALIIFGR